MTNMLETVALVCLVVAVSGRPHSVQKRAAPCDANKDLLKPDIVLGNIRRHLKEGGQLNKHIQHTIQALDKELAILVPMPLSPKQIAALEKAAVKSGFTDMEEWSRARESMSSLEAHIGLLNRVAENLPAEISHVIQAKVLNYIPGHILCSISQNAVLLEKGEAHYPVRNPVDKAVWKADDPDSRRLNQAKQILLSLQKSLRAMSKAFSS